MEERILYSWPFWVLVGIYLLSAGVLTWFKTKYKRNCEFGWGWVFIPGCNWAAFLFFFFFVFLDGIIDGTKNN